MQVLDKGFVNLIDHMGSDRRIAEAAWVSTDAGKGREDKDVRRLIGYLARENHWTPFGHAMVTLQIKWPLFVARQAMRSNVGIVWNEESRRYVSHTPEFYHPAQWRTIPPKSIKQGSGGWVGQDTQDAADELLGALEVEQMDAYLQLLGMGIAPEMARGVLPVTMYTSCYMTASVAALARFVHLRADSHAQWEIQQYALAMTQIVSPLFPVAWAALTAKSQESPVVVQSPAVPEITSNGGKGVT